MYLHISTQSYATIFYNNSILEPLESLLFYNYIFYNNYIRAPGKSYATILSGCSGTHLFIDSGVIFLFFSFFFWGGRADEESRGSERPDKIVA